MKKQRTSKSQKKTPTRSEPLPTLPLEILIHLFSFLPLPDLLILYQSIPSAIIDEAIKKATLCTETTLLLSPDLLVGRAIPPFEVPRIPRLPLRCTGFDPKTRFVWLAPYAGNNMFCAGPLFGAYNWNIGLLDFTLAMKDNKNQYKTEKLMSEQLLDRWPFLEDDQRASIFRNNPPYTRPNGKDFTLWGHDYIIQGYIAWLLPYSETSASAITAFDESLRQSSPPITSDTEPATTATNDEIIEEAFERQDCGWPRAQPRHIPLADICLQRGPMTVVFVDRIGTTLTVLADLQRQSEEEPLCRDPFGARTIFPRRLAFVREMVREKRLPTREVVRMFFGYVRWNVGNEMTEEEMVIGMFKEALMWVRDKKELERLVKKMKARFREGKRLKIDIQW